MKRFLHNILHMIFLQENFKSNLKKKRHAYPLVQFVHFPLGPTSVLSFELLQGLHSHDSLGAKKKKKIQYRRQQNVIKAKTIHISTLL